MGPCSGTLIIQPITERRPSYFRHPRGKSLSLVARILSHLFYLSTGALLSGLPQKTNRHPHTSPQQNIRASCHREDIRSSKDSRSIIIIIEGPQNPFLPDTRHPIGKQTEGP